MGKEVVAYNRDGMPDAFVFLPGAATLINAVPTGQFDVGIVLDAGELRRAGAQLPQCCTTMVNIDHHPHSERFTPLHYVDEQASATGILVYRILKAAGHPLTRDVAYCIYAAILSDTGSFRYSNADPEAFRVAGELIALGINPWDVASNLYENQEEKRLRLLAMALQTLTVSPCGRYASISVTESMLNQTAAGPEHTDGFVNYPRSIHGVEVSLFFRQTAPGEFKVGFRSKGTVDVGALARELGGGGHHNAAGAAVSGTLDQVRANVFARIDRLLV
jgi:phosphoesterase RecJ-like protein